MRPDDIKFKDGDADADAAIDRAVREMMSAEPPADFGRRVRARLERPPRMIFTVPRIAAVAALTAAVALFVLTRDHRPTAPEPRVAIHSEPTTRPGPAPERPQPNPETPRVPVRTDAPSVANVPVERLSDRQVQAASIDPGEMVEAVTDVEPLKPIAPIAMSALTQESISKPEIQIAPLDLSPIEIAPLTAPR